MSHPYTTRAKVRQECLNPDRVAALLDHNGDDVEDSVDGTSAVSLAIKTSCVLIDARLGRRFTTPFAAITDGTPTPELITQICNYLVLWKLYSLIDPDSPEAKSWFSQADALLNGILDNTFHLDAAEVGVATRRPVTYESAGTFAAGRVDYDYTSSGVNKLRGL